MVLLGLRPRGITAVWDGGPWSTRDEGRTSVRVVQRFWWLDAPHKSHDCDEKHGLAGTIGPNDIDALVELSRTFPLPCAETSSGMR